MAVYAQVPETSVTYIITGPDGTRAVLNDTTDSDYVGTFSDDGLTGLDSPEIRENATDLVESDGGVHGNFWYGRRPVTMSIDVLGSSANQRNSRLEKIKRATNALRADGTLQWTTPNSPGAPNQQLTFRRQQPLRISGSWLKTAFVAVVAADPRIYSWTLHTATINPGAGFSTVTNVGDYLSPPSLKINGPGTNPTVTNGTLKIAFNNLVLTAGQYVTVDLIQRTVVDQAGANRYGGVDFINTTWWGLGPGDNNVKLDWVTGSTGASTLVVSWRDAWV